MTIAELLTSIADKIASIGTNIASAYTKIADKGGTMPTEQTSENLADAIDSIPSGGEEEPLYLINEGSLWRKNLVISRPPQAVALGNVNGATGSAIETLVTHGGYTFSNPYTQGIAVRAYKDCTQLTYVYWGLRTTPYDGFWNCSSLTTFIAAEDCDYFNLWLFENANALTKIIIDTEQFVTMSNVNVLSRTQNAIVYVHADEVETYKAATNWATYASRIRAIEDYPEIMALL